MIFLFTSSIGLPEAELCPIEETDPMRQHVSRQGSHLLSTITNSAYLWTISLHKCNLIMGPTPHPREITQINSVSLISQTYCSITVPIALFQCILSLPSFPLWLCWNGMNRVSSLQASLLSDPTTITYRVDFRFQKLIFFGNHLLWIFIERQICKNSNITWIILYQITI